MTGIWASDGPFSRWTKRVRITCTFSSYISIFFFFNLDTPIIDHKPFVWCGKYLIPWKLWKHLESIVCPITEALASHSYSLVMFLPEFFPQFKNGESFIVTYPTANTQSSNLLRFAFRGSQNKQVRVFLNFSICTLF